MSTYQGPEIPETWHEKQERLAREQFFKAEATQAAYDADAPRRKAVAEATEIAVALQQGKVADLLNMKHNPELAKRCPALSMVIGPDQADAYRQEAIAAYQKFQTTLDKKRGIKLNAQGLKKLERIVIFNDNIDWGQDAAWLALWKYASEIFLFDEMDIERTRPLPAQPVGSNEQAPEATLEDALALPSTEANQKIAKRIIFNVYLQTEAAPMMFLWSRWMQEVYGYEVSKSGLDAVVRFIRDHGGNFCDYRMYDKARLALIRDKKFPLLMNEEETLAESIEREEGSVGDYATKRHFANRMARIAGTPQATFEKTAKLYTTAWNGAKELAALGKTVEEVTEFLQQVEVNYLRLNSRQVRDIIAAIF